MKTIQ